MFDLSDIARKWIKTILLIVSGLLLLRLAFKIYHLAQQPANAKYISGGGAIPENWSPDALTDELYNQMKGVSTSANNDAVFEKFNALNDNQMIAVYNRWNDKYSQKAVMWGLAGVWGSLTQAVKDESGYAAFGGANQRDIMLYNLSRLQLP